MAYNASMKHIAESIKEITEKEGITRYRISKDLGIDESNLHYLFKNTSNPEWKTIVKLLDYLGYEYKLFKRKEVKRVKSKPPRSRRNLNRR